MKQVAITLIICCLCGCLGSYQAPHVYDVEKNRVYNKTFDQIWDKTVEWLALHGTGIKNIDKQSGSIASDYNLSTRNYSNYSDCGGGGAWLLMPTAIIDPVGNLNLLIRRIDSLHTMVITTMSFHAKVDQNFHGTDGTTHDYKQIECNSTGVLERELFDYIEK